MSKEAMDDKAFSDLMSQINQVEIPEVELKSLCFFFQPQTTTRLHTHCTENWTRGWGGHLLCVIYFSNNYKRQQSCGDSETT